MSLSNSVLHRYTPPTCTLQVVAYSSPVSRWLGSKVVKQVQFDLRFDDPRFPADKQISIVGDRDQLEALHTVVTDYIQQLLNLSPESFANLGIETPPTSVPPSPSVDVEGDVWLMPVEEPPPAIPEANRGSVAENAQGDALTLKPATKVSHNLFLGSLATASTGKFVQLSLLQLFDLATALDEYASDLVALPTYSNTQTSPPLVWANIAAALLLGVGISAVGLQMFNRPNSQQTANNLNNRPKTINSPQVALAPSPFPIISPAGTLPPPPNAIAVPTNSGAKTTAQIASPSSNPVPPTIPGNQANSVANGLPSQPINIPNAGQNTTTITIPGATSRIAPPIAVIPNPNLKVAPNATTAKITATAAPANTSTKPTTPPKPKVAATRTAFVANPQVAEVSDYFNQRWEAPTNLRSSLEYSIVLDVDGSIQVIEPYGVASRTYLDRTGMPLIGERFVSANQGGQSPRIRLRFNPNGKVQAFLETNDAR